MKLKIIILCALVLTLILSFLLKSPDAQKDEVSVRASEIIPVDLNVSNDEVTLSQINDIPVILNVDEDSPDAKPLLVTRIFKPKRNLREVELGSVKIREIKEALKTGSTFVHASSDQEPITTAEEAFGFMNINISMAYIPEDYFEDDENFYFSGGTTASQVVDFSSGLAVNKKEKSVTSW
jgi:hypothetical protein